MPTVVWKPYRATQSGASAILLNMNPPSTGPRKEVNPVMAEYTAINIGRSLFGVSPIILPFDPILHRIGPKSI